MNFISTSIAAIPSWPILVCVHYYLTVVTLRNEPGGRDLALRHPIASCTLSILIAGSGTIISSIMLGQPVLNSVLNERGILSGVFIWFIVHFSPNDIVYLLSNNIYVKLLLNVLEELRRSRNIMVGVTAASKVYPMSTLPLVLSGTCKGSGKRWSIKIHQALLGDSSKPYELLQLSFCTKACFMLALLFTLMLNSSFVTSDDLVLLGSCALCSVKIYEITFKRNADIFQFIQEKIWKYLTMFEKETLQKEKTN